MTDRPNIGISDEVLMQHFVFDGNRLAFSQIYQKYFKPLSKYIGWLANDIDLGKDLAQNIFIKLYNKPQIYDPDKKFKTWLFVVAKNSLTNEWRNSMNRHRLLEMLTFDSQSPNTPVEADPRLEKITKALDQLSEDHKNIFILKYSGNLSISEISEVENCSIGTVKSRLFYGMKHLREIMNVQMK